MKEKIYRIFLIDDYLSNNTYLLASNWTMHLIVQRSIKPYFSKYYCSTSPYFAKLTVQTHIW